MNEFALNRYVSIVGGLGNQLFQVAEAMNTVSKSRIIVLDQFQGNKVNKTPEILLYDFTFNGLQSGYLAVRSQFVSQLAHNLILRFSNSLEKKSLIKRILGIKLQNVSSWILQLTLVKKLSIYAQPSIGYSRPQKPKLRVNDLQIGYFQHCHWINNKNVVQELRRLQLKKKTEIFLKYEEKFKNLNFLCIHMRFGDYLNEKDFGIPDINYYKKSLEYHLRNSNYDEILLFTNDKNLALEKIHNFTDLDLEIVSTDSGLTTSETLELMRMARGYIIANSTFSWWGAFLSHKADCLVTRPSPWFSGLREPKLLFPEAWVGIRYVSEI